MIILSTIMDSPHQVCFVHDVLALLVIASDFYGAKYFIAISVENAFMNSTKSSAANLFQEFNVIPLDFIFTKVHLKQTRKKESLFSGFKLA